MSTDNVHIDHTWLPKFTKLRLTAFGEAVIAIANDPAFDDWTFSQRLAYALEKEEAARQSRKIDKLLKQSKSPQPDACIEEVRYLSGRSLNRESITRLAHCQWIDQAHNLVILGPTSVGKTYLAQAFVNAACRKLYSCRFYRTQDLLARLDVIEHAAAERMAFLEELASVDLLVLDDFMTTRVTTGHAETLLAILSAREHTGSVLITSQFEPDQWHKLMPDKVVADSLLSRLVGGAEILNVDGPNMRLKQHPP